MIENARQNFKRAYPVLAVAGMALNPDKEVLLIQRSNPPSQGCWTLPGGKVELGENLQKALSREFAEETGFDIEVLNFLTTVEIFDICHFVILDYKVKIVGGTRSPGSDASNCRWFNRETIRNIELTHGLFDILQKGGF